MLAKNCPMQYNQDIKKQIYTILNNKKLSNAQQHQTIRPLSKHLDTLRTARQKPKWLGIRENLPLLKKRKDNSETDLRILNPKYNEMVLLEPNHSLNMSISKSQREESIAGEEYARTKKPKINLELVKDIMKTHINKVEKLMKPFQNKKSYHLNSFQDSNFKKSYLDLKTVNHNQLKFLTPQTQNDENGRSIQFPSSRLQKEKLQPVLHDGKKSIDTLNSRLMVQIKKSMELKQEGSKIRDLLKLQIEEGTENEALKSIKKKRMHSESEGAIERRGPDLYRLPVIGNRIHRRDEKLDEIRRRYSFLDMTLD